MQQAQGVLDWHVGSSVPDLTRWFIEHETLRGKSQHIPLKHSTDDVLRVCTYNCHFWLGPSQSSFVSNTEAIVKVIEQCDADVLVLNEYVPIRESSLLPVVGEHLQKLGYVHSTLASSPKWTDVTFVTVVFSRLAFLQTQKEEQLMLYGDRHAVHVAVDLKGTKVHIFGLHLDVYDEDGTTRLKQAQHVLSKCSQLENVVIAGDLNSLRRSDYCDADWEKIVEHDKRRG